MHSIMEAFLTEYHIDFPKFQALLRDTPSLVAGSSSLALYLKSNGVDPGYEPGDIDIWIEECTYQGQYVETLFLNFLFTQGYYLQKVFINNDEDNGKYDFQNNNIRTVSSLVDDNERKIQIITIGERNLKNYIEKAFDLSICVSWWNATNNTFETLSPELTLQKKMYISNKILQNQYVVEDRTIKLDGRIKKYINRGFQLEEIPCPIFERADCRSALSHESFRELSAFDLFAYEDVSFCEFLKASSWHIVIKAGDTFQAFHRKQLYTYMSSRETYVSFLQYIYDTPNNQSILQCALDILLYADYSIYELCSEYSISISPNKEKSMFTLKCYTIEQWLENKEGLTLSPPSPPHSSLPNIPEPISDVIPYVVPSNIPDDIAVISADITNVDAFNVIINALRSSYELENVYNPSQENAINYALDIIQDLENYFHVQQNE